MIWRACAATWSDRAYRHVPLFHQLVAPKPPFRVVTCVDSVVSEQQAGERAGHAGMRGQTRSRRRLARSSASVDVSADAGTADVTATALASYTITVSWSINVAGPQSGTADVGTPFASATPSARD